MRALVLRQPTTPAVPAYPNDNTLVVSLDEPLTDYSPVYNGEAFELAEGYELEDELPNGLCFDSQSGAIEGFLSGRPLPVSLDLTVGVRSVNRVSKGEPVALRVTTCTALDAILLAYDLSIPTPQPHRHLFDDETARWHLREPGCC